MEHERVRSAPIAARSRGRHLRRAAAVGMSLAAMGALAACGGGGSSTSTSDGGTATAAAGDVPVVGTEAVRTPEATGELDAATWGLTYEPTSLNWVSAYAPVENSVLANVTESLMRLTPEFTYEPALAESMDTPNPTTYVFTLRQGVTFTDGSEMTADDVVFSLKRSLDPSSYWAPWLTSVKTIEKTGDYEVTVKLKQPDVIFPQMMALPAGAVGSAAAIEKAGEGYGTPKSLPVGTGPFEVTEWNAGSSLVLTRNEDYWDTENPAKTKQLTFSFLSDANTMVNALTTGEIDGAYYLPYEALDRLEESGTGELFQGPSMLNALMFWTTKEGPQLDAKVREAWLLATDRAAIAETVYHGAAAPLPSTFVPLPVWGYSEEEAQAAYEALPGPSGDLERAKQLIEESGIDTSQPMKIAIKAQQLDEQMATVIQAAAQSIGLTVEIEKMPAPDLINLLYDEEARTKYNAFITGGYYSDIPDPVELFDELIGTAKPGALTYNYLEWEDPEVQGLITEARETADDEKRGELLLEAQKLQAEQVPVFPIVAPASLVYLNDRVTGVPASFVYNYYPWARDLGAK